MSKLDSCDSLCYELPNALLRTLHNIQNKAARLIRNILQRERITQVLIYLHWPSIKQELCIRSAFLLKFGEPKYLKELLTPFELETNII